MIPCDNSWFNVCAEQNREVVLGSGGRLLKQAEKRRSEKALVVNNLGEYKHHIIYIVTV